MTQTIPDIHHVTTIAIDPQANIDFYTQVLGHRFVKETESLRSLLICRKSGETHSPPSLVWRRSLSKSTTRRR
jgi:catechol 2,3-dioxygenase-like lactoylglutathione lyase family enzyme